MTNPYPLMIEDVSGTKTPNRAYEIWEEGYEAALKEVGENLEKPLYAVLQHLDGTVYDYKNTYEAVDKLIEALKRGEKPK